MPTIRFTRTHSIMLTAALAAVLAACGGGGSDEPEEEQPLTSQISAVVDGAAVNADTILVGDFKAGSLTRLMAIHAATATQGQVFLLVTENSAPGTYQCADSKAVVTLGDVEKSSGTTAWADAPPPHNLFLAGAYDDGTTLGSCSITVTSSDANFITGTFTATLENEAGTSTKTVTGGTFRVPYIPLPTT